MKNLIYIILICPLLALGQSPQANQLFDFNYEKNQLTIDTMRQFDGLTNDQIINLSDEWLSDLIKTGSEIYQMRSGCGIRGEAKFSLYDSFSSERWIDFRVTILAKEGRARMIVENIETHSFQKKRKGYHGKVLKQSSSAMALYDDQDKYLSSDLDLKLQNRVESTFIEFIESWVKNVNKSMVRQDDW